MGWLVVRWTVEYVVHVLDTKDLIHMLDANVWFVCWTQISGSYVGREYLIHMVDANIWFVCWTRISGSYVGHEYLVR